MVGTAGTDEFMLQPGIIDAITEFWNWINDGVGSGGVGLHGDFNMAGSYDVWESAWRPELNKALHRLRLAGVQEREWPQDRHWDCAGKWLLYGGC